jgi:hypothetical protein
MNTKDQDLFNYLSNELNVISTQTQMQEIERIILKKLEKIYTMENSENTQKELIDKFLDNVKIIMDNDLEILELKHKIDILKYQNNIFTNLNITLQKFIK